jgi:hypothetical protein
MKDGSLFETTKDRTSNSKKIAAFEVENALHRLMLWSRNADSPMRFL